MKTCAIQTLGRKVNPYKSRQLRQVLEQFGLSEAAHQPCVVIVTGCLPAGQDNEPKNLSRLLIVNDKNTLPAILDRLFREQPPDLSTNVGSKPLNTCKIKDKNDALPQINPLPSDKSNKNMHDPINHNLPPFHHFTGQCRGFLGVQDGCNAWCTYCIIPKIRKNVCNKDVKSVLDEAKGRISAGPSTSPNRSVLRKSMSSASAPGKTPPRSKRPNCLARSMRKRSTAGHRPCRKQTNTYRKNPKT